MNVIFNTYPVAFQCPGGGEIQLMKSIEALSKQGIDVIKFDPWSTKLTDADVVHHFSTQGGSMNFCGYVHNQGIPLVVSPIIWLGDKPDIYPLGEISELLRVADVICPNSSAEAHQLGSYFNIPEKKFVITHNGIDEIFTQKVDGELFRDHYSINEPFILCVGNIEPRKNQLKLIESIQNLNIKLILIGNIRDEPYFTQCKNADIKNSMDFVGHINHHDPLLRSAYSACEVFVLPSMLETPGLAALEAAATGSKIVITEVGATQEYFGENVFYINPTSIDSISNAITTALKTDRPLFKDEMLKYSWDNTAKQLINAYHKALE